MAQTEGPRIPQSGEILLPLIEVPAIPPRRPVKRGDTGPKSILIIDDNVDAANAMAALLRHDKHTVSVAHSGEEGMEIANRLHPEVALVDLGCPA